MAVTAAPAGAAPAAAGVGLPQFDVAQWPGQIVWVLIVFVVMFALFRWVFVPRLASGFDARESRIAADIAEARALRDRAQADADVAANELAAARAGAQKLAADASAEAKAAAADRQAAEEARLAEALAASETRIAAARDAAMANVRAIAVTTAQAIVEKLTGSAPPLADVETALDAHA